MKRHAAISLITACVVSAAHAGTSLYDDGEVGVRAEIRSGIVEPAVPVYLQGQSQAAAWANVIEAYDRVPGTGSYPLTFVDLVANTYLRSTYQLPDGGSAPLTTSVVGAASLRTSAGLDLIPTVSRVDFAPHPNDRFHITTYGIYDSGANVTSTAGFPDPAPGRTVTTLKVEFGTDVDIALASGTPFVGNDRFRFVTLSSMWASPTAFDANLMRFEDAAGQIHVVEISAATAQNAHLFAAPIPVGGWVELLKTPGSTWQPGSPSIRLDIVDAAGMQLGLQAFHVASLNPNDDSFSAWLEVIDAPDVVGAGTRLAASFAITAFAVPEPSTFAMMLAGILILMVGKSWPPCVFPRRDVYE